MLTTGNSSVIFDGCKSNYHKIQGLFICVPTARLLTEQFTQAGRACFRGATNQLINRSVGMAVGESKSVRVGSTTKYSSNGQYATVGNSACKSTVSTIQRVISHRIVGGSQAERTTETATIINSANPKLSKYDNCLQMDDLGLSSRKSMAFTTH